MPRTANDARQTQTGGIHTHRNQQPHNGDMHHARTHMLRTHMLRTHTAEPHIAILQPRRSSVRQQQSPHQHTWGPMLETTGAVPGPIGGTLGFGASMRWLIVKAGAVVREDTAWALKLDAGSYRPGPGAVLSDSMQSRTALQTTRRQSEGPHHTNMWTYNTRSWTHKLSA